MKLVKVGIPTLALAGLLFGLLRTPYGAKAVGETAPVAPPPRNGFTQSVSGTGLVEPSSGNIAIGTPVAGLVTRVLVEPGQAVRSGDALFQIDDRALKAELEVRRAAVQSVRQKLERLRNFPRQEEVDPVAAQVQEAEANLTDQRQQLARRVAVKDPRVVTEDELERRRFAVRTAEARLDAAKAQLRLIQAGSWIADRKVLEGDLALAEAEVSRTETELARLTVRAPQAGKCLQVNIREGEYADPARGSEPLVLLGVTQPLHVRAEIDEYEAARVLPGAAAYASPRGQGDQRLPLRFVRFEPYMVAKRSLSNDTAQRVDTRVLQVIYRVDPLQDGLFIGQQVDVFIDAGKGRAQ